MNKTTSYFGIIFLLVISVYIFSDLEFSNTKNDLNFKQFNIDLPANWEKIEFRGIDSYVGGITNGIDTLEFDYGLYSYDFGYEEREKQFFATDTINGKIAILTKPKEIGNGMIGIYMKRAFENNDFNLIGNDISNEELILNIFKSIRFKNSDTLINSKRIEFNMK